MYVCNGCGNIINGRYTMNNYGVYHSECFKCSCGKPILGTFQIVNGKPICIDCFRCEGPCQKPISGQYFTINNKNVCPNCFNRYGYNFEKYIVKEEPKKEEPKKQPEERKMGRSYIPIYY